MPYIMTWNGQELSWIYYILNPHVSLQVGRIIALFDCSFEERPTALQKGDEPSIAVRVLRLFTLQALEVKIVDFRCITSFPEAVFSPAAFSRIASFL
ncbi:hypothetical protein CEXT_360001 [Caerostris extrusa]|uniref:Uncharacterized protein n=1 Tax=Caerostris extrusa TaxID=172846 RepID=A0AAV4YCA9_CAEEX|nr:hypothetical protein CEXT_360001 [Caerostris extrusa]